MGSCAYLLWDYAYGAKGIAVERGETFQILSFLYPEHATMVTAVVEAANKDLWLMGARGVVCVPVADVRARWWIQHMLFPQ